MTSGEAESAATVRRRRVFYIPGYDPFHPRRYRELYRREAAAQAEISGYRIAVTGRTGAEVYGWDVAAAIEGAEVTADIEVLVWTDIVRDSMTGGIVQTYLLLLRTAWIYISTGALWRLVRLRKGPVVAALYPVVMLLGQLALALLLAWGVARLAGLLLPGWAGWILGLALVPLVLEWFRRLDAKLFVYYLMHDYAFSARWRGAMPPVLQARIESFADRVAEALAEKPDEVLIVGHSSGAHIALAMLAGLIRAGRLPADGPTVSLLTLGQAIPMVSFLPEARDLRADLRLMSEQTHVAWIDISAPGDGCSFALCDPVSVSGVARAAKRWPLVLSAAFTQTLAPETWTRLKRRYFRLHFQYLCAFDRPGDYTYFAVTAGPRTLSARFAHRAPSASRIETPLSPYRDCAP
ncbi:hypothetical protein DDZ14_14695 [Maritimibacter sp. 55A14]|uniref:hypothetical protein n=1 Tax=Maritimibacter sp. 55A14 TaxID=2174844 RepID=UPI000D6162E3|nr:hypothetical protein [Maritimibacter sp. 55A14]PWE30693.1 hypothetical protein DDZ14_14695 [Maritimibacter sp. 55A14]